MVYQEAIAQDEINEINAMGMKKPAKAGCVHLQSKCLASEHPKPSTASYVQVSDTEPKFAEIVHSYSVHIH